MGDELTLTRAERDRLCVIRNAAQGRVGAKEAGERLGVSERQARRLVARWHVEGDAVGVHGLKGRPGNRGSGKERSRTRKKALKLFKEEYDDYGPTLLSEVLAARGVKVPRESLRRWLVAAGLRKGPVLRKVHRRRQRRPRYGELVQVDGSHHDWFEGRGGATQVCLVGLIDDATGECSGRFYGAETSHAILEEIRSWVTTRGRPEAMYTDMASLYAGQVSKEGDTRERSQVGRALGELDVELILAKSPQAKGRIERSFRTHQDRLVKWLRREQISTIAEANARIEEYWRQHNDRRCRPPADPRDAHRQLTAVQQRTLGEICCVREARSLGQGDVVKLDGRTLLIRKQGRGGPRPRARIEVLKAADGNIRLRWQARDLLFEDVTEAHRDAAPARAAQARLKQRRQRLEARLAAAGVPSPDRRSLGELTMAELVELDAGRPSPRPRPGHPWGRPGVGARSRAN